MTDSALFLVNLILCDLCHGWGKLKLVALGVDTKIRGLDLFFSIHVGEMHGLGCFVCRSAHIDGVESYINRP